MLEVNGFESNYVEPSPQLQHAIERLYEVFADYPPNLEGCPCCITQEMKEPLESKSLRELTGDDLFSFQMQVICTWSDEDGFRHFLPRMLDLVASEQECLLELFLITGKIAYAKWWKWPESEQKAIEAFLAALWSCGIQNNSPAPLDIGETLIGISVVSQDIRPYLQEWSEEPSGAGTLHLGQFVYSNVSALLEERPRYQKPRLGSPSWGWSDNELKAMEQIIHWLLEPDRLTSLKMLRDHPPQAPLDFDLDKAIQTLEALQART